MYRVDISGGGDSSFRDLKGAVLDERRRKALLEFVKNCPVHNTLKVNPLVDIKLV